MVSFVGATLVLFVAWHDLGRSLFQIGCLLSLICWLRFGGWKAYSPEEWWLSALLLAWFGWMLISWSLVDGSNSGWNAIWNRNFYVVLIPVVAWAISRMHLSVRVILPAFLAAGLVAVVVLYAEKMGWFGGRYGGRAALGMNPNEIGLVVVCYSALVLQAVVVCRGHLRFMALLALACFIWLLLDSGSRGSWAAMAIILLATASLELHRFNKLAPRYKLAFALAVVVLVGGLTQVPMVKSRYEYTVSELSTILNSPEIHQTSPSSLGWRLHLWRAAVEIGANNAGVGVGVRGFQDATSELASHGYPASLGYFKHAHNIYLSAFATGGIPGLILVVALFAAVMTYFVRARTNIHAAGDLSVRLGIAVVAAYSIAGLADDFFYGRPTLYAFALFVALAMSGVMRDRNSAQSDAPASPS